VAGIWPAKFPIRRVLIAFLVIPGFSNLALAVLNVIWSLTHAPAGQQPEAVADAVALAILFSWPGYLTFLVIGLPTLYALYRVGWSGFTIFAVIGAVYTFLPWFVLGESPAHISREAYVRDSWEQFKVLGSVGAVNGILTRLIVVGRRWSW
jgi:hypothetical protein